MNRKVDLIDFGCGKGGSIRYLSSVLGCDNFIGIDNKDINVDFEFFKADLTEEASVPYRSDYVSCFNFLPNLHNSESVLNVILLGLNTAEKGLVIRQANFDHSDYLKDLGFQYKWSNMSSNRMRLTSLEFMTMLGSIFTTHPEIHAIFLGSRHPIYSAGHDFIPYSASRNSKQGDYDEIPPETSLGIILWKEIQIYIALEKVEISDIAEKFDFHMISGVIYR
jgi:hypothetical protein